MPFRRVYEDDGEQMPVYMVDAKKEFATAARSMH